MGVRYNEFNPPHQARIFHGYGVERLMFLAGRVPMSDTPTQKHILGLVLSRFFDDALSGVAPSLRRLDVFVNVPCGSASAFLFGFGLVALVHGVRAVLLRAEALPRARASPLAAKRPRPRSGQILAFGRFTKLLAAGVGGLNVISSALARGSRSRDDGCNQQEHQTQHFLSTQVNVGLVD